jgi:hypothetical protein
LEEFKKVERICRKTPEGFHIRREILRRVTELRGGGLEEVRRQDECLVIIGAAAEYSAECEIGCGTSRGAEGN